MLNGTRSYFLVQDVGQSLNPHIDLGQIEGPFMQGVGLFTMEELMWGDQTPRKSEAPGKLLTTGPDTYKIPSFGDVPLDFRVALLAGSSNPRAIYSSKGVGVSSTARSIRVLHASFTGDRRRASNDMRR